MFRESTIWLCLLGAHLLAANLDAQSVLQGRVVDVRLHTPLAGAEVSLDSTGRRAIAVAEGRFRLEGLTRGALKLTARAVGFAPISATLELPKSLQTQLCREASLAARTQAST